MYKFKMYFSLYLAGEIVSRGCTKVIKASSEDEAKQKLQLRYLNIDVFISHIELLWPDE